MKLSRISFLCAIFLWILFAAYYLPTRVNAAGNTVSWIISCPSGFYPVSDHQEENKFYRSFDGKIDSGFLDWDDSVAYYADTMTGNPSDTPLIDPHGETIRGYDMYIAYIPPSTTTHQQVAEPYVINWTDGNAPSGTIHFTFKQNALFHNYCTSTPPPTPTPTLTPIPPLGGNNRGAPLLNCTNGPDDRCAECDACGYCFGKEIPENWLQCKSCIYPTADDDALTNTTLEIDPIYNKPLLQPEKGKYFTQLGCIDTSLSSFQDAGAAGGVLNFILTRVMFPITGVLAFISIIYGAFLLATAQDEQLQIQRGKRYVYGGIVGAIFTFSVVLIVNTIGSDILRIPGFSRGTPIEISAAAHCGENSSGDLSCPSIKIRILDTSGQVVIEESVGIVQGVPEGSFPNNAAPGPGILVPQFNTLTYYSNLPDIKKGTEYTIEVVADDLNTNPPNYGGDRNIFLESVIIGNNICNPSKMIYLGNNREQQQITAPYGFGTMQNNGTTTCDENAWTQIN
jgi:hypothetical protein